MRATLKKHNIRFRERLAASKVIAILRAEDTEYFADVAQVLYDSGIRVIEAALTTPGALDAIAQMQVELGPDTMVGAGSVRTVSDVDNCASAGVDFLVTPTFSADVLDRAQQYSLPVVCGALTPTEIDAAWRRGAAVVKVFPIGPVGGVEYLRAVRAPLPEIPLVPTGGVALPEVEAYLGAGAFAVAAASPLIGDAVCGRRLDELARRASDLASLAGKFV
ncbi:bifunctional 4-hydroxy-2-oxoglutarate aldolase/2-dehydro-3-deoxy-phosphogluconate aldolase [Amycolatopsis acidiphila]|uniref:Bifunctional 4-hydroxy-2-oxoglutarate aldolase/2-dehydro-3-deoxy-phosphogluconate aldolase n=1 Tax=Amycolatopsis acidiphila TaxID=715473 RepID=A0A558A9S4_9PSEU|nr:bifunctional 4-hydroxy-2-oxoglutarate aldolase/2-dehydro-3-deoxy-phosphogluconate aldolase [Amycolatopsis acidiphila]TVT20994.1 bifunctional 4-hydroxy-2-oxoglutarate aldolase/2-dehydro-3-deoxy-phosphogluconate aldolase [Amycolatopsis acidiphila]UIJ61345.1 bifunctional 4-hydroxy-2-oxoglutarate aldolase/2-dehydro-3-deoxy-phosphogluconate aldolase [Amycolatopsis acidiphila]GHG78105.1 2-dehydro-3-deoxy-phosphogluconate aldolase [Amycolatopsis acidiphila]